MTTIAVLGRGIAGAAATWAAREAGAKVLSFGGPPLASTMTSGAADDEAWELGVPPQLLDADLTRFFAALGGWSFPDRSSAVVATSAGVLRPARGHDAHVLDLASLPTGTVGIPRLERPSWDADALALAWNDEPLARAVGLRFEAIDADLLHRIDERVLPEVDLAARIATPERRALLDARLATLAATGRFVALLVPAGLGLAHGEDPPLRTGEILSAPGGPAGLRLAARLQSALPAPTAATARVEIASEGDGRLVLRHGNGERLEITAAVLAVGGLIGGGIAYRRTDPAAVLSPIPRFHAEGFGAALIGLHGDQAAIELPIGEVRWSHASGGALERIGILHRDQRVRREDGGVFPQLFVAGDVAASRPRTLLTAVRDGITAGRAAASVSSGRS